jgi:hypothetical protein
LRNLRCRGLELRSLPAAHERTSGGGFVTPRCPDCGAPLFAQTFFLHKTEDGNTWLLAPLMPHICELEEAS